MSGGPFVTAPSSRVGNDNAQPDEAAWERAHHHYLQLFAGRGWSDIQEQQPKSLAELDGASSGKAPQAEPELACASS